MAYSWLEITPEHGPAGMFALKELLVSVGWTVLASGDGLAAYGAATDVILNADDGGVANSLWNVDAWFRIEHPDGVREFTFQTGATKNNYRVKFSVLAGFTGLPQPGAGPINSTDTPSATDEIIVHGGGTDDVPTQSPVFSGIDGSFRFKAGADSSAPYNMWAFALIKGGNLGVTINGGVWIETLEQLDPADVDGTFIRISTTSNSATALSDDDTGGGSCFVPSASPTPDDWLRYSCYLSEADGGACLPSAQATNPISNAVDMFPLMIGRRGTTSSAAGIRHGPGVKGVSSQSLWIGSVRSVGAVLSTVAGAMDYIIMDTIAVPWKGTVPVI